MRKIKEIAPNWVKAVEENGSIPNVIKGMVKINGDYGGIGNPNACFIGEARGGNCYYDKVIHTTKKSFWTRRTKKVTIPNPKYCEECSDMSMEFFHISDACSDKFDEAKYKKLCKDYEKHYNKVHGDTDQC